MAPCLFFSTILALLIKEQHAVGGRQFMNRPLAGKVAVVTGASRGIGKGVAIELGAAGATVYVAARSNRGRGVTTDRTVKVMIISGHPRVQSLSFPLQFGPDCSDSTIEATAEAVTTMGGLGIAVQCDAGCDADVAALMKRVREEHGRLDILVCR